MTLYKKVVMKKDRTLEEGRVIIAIGTAPVVAKSLHACFRSMGLVIGKRRDITHQYYGRRVGGGICTSQRTTTKACSLCKKYFEGIKSINIGKRK
ncbi:hypothetical protein [Lactococcus formosensis]|uniref:hypothetical protein n=1 Tax=Lactococcus formosensis TaxID=1281486 RepID=UPI00037F9EE1|nr:hypothetical protein [Lactococcus formosensis]MCH1722029.1 hypothetical protein [Lactococcus formosensis]MDG6113698.1 hypothetical protein [Lactococcus formosensis]MDG6115735.1 hypothetical protein [Lactococcus formosensis]MDG6119951.1 hypothetical protein [Lactococcus formosensis]MDG6122310.1 hypothetical protein [Lactococcus formosensis]